MQSASIDSNPSSPASIGRKETTGTTKCRRKQSYPSKAPASPDVANFQHEHNEEKAHDFTTWSNKMKNKVFVWSTYYSKAISRASPIACFRWTIRSNNLISKVATLRKKSTWLVQIVVPWQQLFGEEIWRVRWCAMPVDCTINFTVLIVRSLCGGTPYIRADVDLKARSQWDTEVRDDFDSLYFIYYYIQHIFSFPKNLFWWMIKFWFCFLHLPHISYYLVR